MPATGSPAEAAQEQNGHSDGHSDGRQSARPLRILLVEDDLDDTLLLRRHLTRVGFQLELHRVETAENMLAALHELDEPNGIDEPWDCILADYNLPQFSAPEALKLLQHTGHDIPFIMMSGAVSEDTAVAAMRAGAHDYVSKSNLARLGPAIEREVSEARSRRTKRATEQALRFSEERFHRLVEATPLALLMADAKGRVTYCNEGAERLLGMTATAVEQGSFLISQVFDAGETVQQALDQPPSQPSNHDPSHGPSHGPSHVDQATRSRGIIAALDARVRGGNAGTWEMVCCHLDGTRIPALIGAAALNPEAPAPGRQFAVFIVNLTEQKRSEEVLRRTEKLAAAGRLAASIAHEINNPLEAITNCLYLLDGLNLGDDARSYLQMAQRELDRVTHITTQTLRFYRQSTRPALTDVADLFESVLALYEARMRGHGIQTIREYRGAPPILAMDGEVRQVLANLVGNAVDAMAGGPEPRILHLRVRAKRCWRTGAPGVSVLIADRGTGIGPAILDRIFEPFFSTKGITGTGLGLWVTREIIAKHNGRLQIRTREQAPSGTVFRLFFFLNPQADAPASFADHQTLPQLR